MSINNASGSYKTIGNMPIIKPIVREPVNKIIEKHLHKILTPDTVRQIQFELQQRGYDFESITVRSNDHIFSIKKGMEDYIIHYYFEDGMWKNEIC